MKYLIADVGTVDMRDDKPFHKDLKSICSHYGLEEIWGKYDTISDIIIEGLLKHNDIDAKYLEETVSESFLCFELNCSDDELMLFILSMDNQLFTPFTTSKAFYAYYYDKVGITWEEAMRQSKPAPTPTHRK